MNPLYFDNKLLIHNTDGQRVFLDPNELHMTCHMLEHGVWEPQVRTIIKASLNANGKYVDVGANIGLHALYAASIVGEGGIVVAYEPNARLFDLLKMNIEANGFSSRAVLNNIAVSDKKETKCFYTYEGHSSMSGFMPQHTDFDVKSTKSEVSCTCLDEDLRGMVIDVLKIDVEGFEYLVLCGARDIIKQNQHLTIIFEFIPKDIKERCGEDVIEKELDCFGEDWNIYVSKFGKPLQKIAFEDRDKLMEVDQCDLILCRDNHLDCLVGIEPNPETEEQSVNDNDQKELVHLRKAYKEAIAVQEELKEEIKRLQNEKRIFRWLKR